MPFGKEKNLLNVGIFEIGCLQTSVDGLIWNMYCNISLYKIKLMQSIKYFIFIFILNQVIDYMKKNRKSNF